MPATAHSLPITGSISDGDGTPQVVLTERLVGYDTFLTGVLDSGQQRVPVRIITLDDVTVLRPVEATALVGATDTYSGVLHLSHGSRRRTIPEDLALEVARRHRTLDLLDEAELRYALTFLEEATTETIRQARIAVIADAVASVDSPAAEAPGSNDGDHSAAAPALVTVDVGGTIGTTDRPGITAALVAASPLARRAAVQLLRERLHTAPAITDQVVEEVCRTLRIPVTAFPRHATATPLRLFTFAAAALEQISVLLPVVTLSNVTCVEADLPQLRQLLAPWVDDHFPSCRIGYAKPDPRAFEAVAAQRCIDTTQMVHIGDDWECDVLGATRVGARAIWISGGRPLPEATEAVKSNVLVATDLAAATRHVREICAGRYR
ncbi:HAD family hydrolase [Couchioplanes caeruleus]|uniref:HAD family hydrolase n=1 Tax=Couchioplanes caeruleus TaxID=56438 RepID=UPI0020BE7D65|nr:HAD family hydrolase [Couchioplanes caeruleus]UQU64774.1 HAD family hydrolase [Couchioplanes caeruleus]